MPHARANGINLYYEMTGSGPAIVLLSGLGADGHFWYQQVPALAARFSVIAVDNRDAGRSDKPEVAYTLRTMADDVAGLLDALEIPSAHLVAASMGGFIAQEFALAYPQRLRRLV
ncbi:MAG: alpha/beta fold hydrolase, partial [bacterium]